MSGFIDRKVICCIPKKSMLWMGTARGEWEVKEGKACWLGGAKLSLENAAPPLRNPPPSALPLPPPAAPPKKLTEGEKIDRVWETILTRKAALPPPLPSPVAVASPEPVPSPFPDRTVKKFDLQYLPGAMDRMNEPICAALLRKWFSLSLNYPVDSDGKKKGVNKNGNSYSASHVDTTTVTLAWILAYPRALARFRALKEMLRTPAALSLIAKKLNKLPTGTREIAAYRETDRQKRHELFQFQTVDVDVESLEKYVLYAEAKERGHPDDLAGALGGFAFYAAIHAGDIEHFHGKRVATIKHVDFYMKNPYSFFDDPEDGGTQYLGHWSKDGVLLSMESFGASRTGKVMSESINGGFGKYIGKQVSDWDRGRKILNPKSQSDWTKSPIVLGEISAIGDNIYYPVTNADFREWQMKHRQGGDMLLFSDFETARLKMPIVVEL